VAVAVAVMPGFFVLVLHAARGQPFDGPAQIFDHTGLELDGGQRTGGTHHGGGQVPLPHAGPLQHPLQVRGNVVHVRSGPQTHLDRIAVYSGFSHDGLSFLIERFQHPKTICIRMQMPILIFILKF